MDKYAILQSYFGHSAFRPGQEALIDAILGGRDVLGIMPTGGGKSMCYQIPALMLSGVAIVISPLISLMKDQVSALRESGIRAAYINSSLSERQIALAYERMCGGEYTLVYVAPERLETPSFLDIMQKIDISLIAVDEAHCISQWGQDFRPSYLKIRDFIDALPRRPAIAAFTATATPRVREDILRLLALENPLCELTGFDRPNLYFEVQQPAHKKPVLLQLVRERQNQSGIVYCSTRALVEEVCEELLQQGISATRYHAGLSDEERQANQDDFQYDAKSVMVATNAFGMGIDKSNVRYVIHYNMPKSLEAYYQEAGRAGRDGAPADCILLYSGQDIMTAKFFIEHNDNEELTDEERDIVRKQDYARLQAMINYCKTRRCLRGHILEYFGQAHDEVCGNCGNCEADFETHDITQQGQMILSCVLRIRRKLGYSVGKTLVLQTLRGSRGERIQELGLDTLSTYGLLRDYSEAQVRTWMDFLEIEGFLRTRSEYSTLEVAESADDVLRGNRTLCIPVRAEPVQTESKKKRTKKNYIGANADTDGLFEALRRLRLSIAQEIRKPAYIVFDDAALMDMARKKPADMREFLQVSGVGEVKARRYGKTFLEEIRRYLNTHEE